jgi:hypothetical protein
MRSGRSGRYMLLLEPIQLFDVQHWLGLRKAVDGKLKGHMSNQRRRRRKESSGSECTNSSRSARDMVCTQ